MTKAKKVKALVTELQTIREEYIERLNEIRNNADYSESYKTKAYDRAKKEAETKLIDIREQIKTVLPEIEALTVKQKNFDYKNSDLISAMKFIQMSGKNVPESAWRQMIENHADNPSELFFLASLLERNGIITGAIEAKETANKICISTELPHRVSDMVYYVSEADITDSVNMDNVFSGLDSLDNYESQLSLEQSDN